jgi:hypothetical protein
MATITLRSAKGSPLTNAEIDGNFTNLNNAKLETNGSGANVTNLNAGNIATGTLAVARGGTGQTTYTNGQLLIGNTTGNTLTKATLTAGTNIAITNGTGTISIATIATPSFTTVTTTGNATVGGDLAVNGGDITISGSNNTVSVFNANATTFNIGAQATAVNIGAATGTLTVNNATLAAKAITASTTLGVTGNATIGGTLTVTGTITGSITGNAGTVTNGVYTTGNQTIGGIKTFSSNIVGNLTGNLTGNTTVGGTLGVTGATTLSSTLAVTGNATVGGALTVTGNLNAPNTLTQVIHKRVDTKVTYAVPAYVAGTTANGVFIALLDTTITPKFSTSKVLVNMCISFEVHNDTIFRLYRVVGGVSTEIGTNSTDANRWSGIWHTGYDSNDASTPRTNTYFFYDTPNTANAVTYRLMCQSSGVGATTFFLNRTISSAGASGNEVAISQVLLQEIC